MSTLLLWLKVPWLWIKTIGLALGLWAKNHWAGLLAQIGHFLAGYAFALTGYRFHHVWISGVLLEVWAIPKEFWFDYKYEDAVTRGSSPLDFALYQIGFVVGCLVIYL
jgi:hypothetical protein